ncbi:methylamine utilization protein MauJ [Bradyrhizobium sp. CCBAU 51753]|uniref:methylamine utilization protein MauJ n=1 Tax=Bradyrhizobium sp. CCBAU 51753 TaxID=1325100 RepID=UPI00188A275D|nr:methylamine utilization protein MauJ [Bradyrhizobium sp. CCBAU 51753]
MYAKNLARILGLLNQNSDVSYSSQQEMDQRFESIRRYGRLPRGRERREEKLSSHQIAAAIFGLVPTHPGWAGHVATVLEGLRPVGGADASFFMAETISDVVSILLANKEALTSFIRMTLTIAETGVNSRGGAEVAYLCDGEKRRAYFVPSGAASLLTKGSEIGFDPDRGRINAPAMREMSFTQEFFRRLARESELAERFPAPPEGDGSEYDAEEAEQERYRKLGVRNGSRFLNVGVDNQVTWPKEEKLITFDQYQLVLMPKTKDHVQSVHVDLMANRVDESTAMTIVNRFLSVMAWCDDNFAIAEYGWSGNSVPVPVSKRDLAFTTAHDYIFDRKIPGAEEARRALALYREARNAQQNGFISYAVLNYYKIIEIRHPGKEAARTWFRTHFEALQIESKDDDDINRFLALCGNDPPHKYIHDSCRIAVAHAGKHSKSDPDDAHEIVRLHTAARVMHKLARRFIEQEFTVSDVMYSGD